MQTFVPLISSFDDMAKTLDRARLNKQALEGWQILMTLLELDPQGNHRTPKGWVNHPAVKMWRGYETALYLYIQAMVEEWLDRGYKSTIGIKAKATFDAALSAGLAHFSPTEAPEWMTNRELFDSIASSHRTALLNKDYEWYSQFGWPEDTGKRPETYEYIWPI
jgi:hypothetical protein